MARRKPSSRQARSRSRRRPGAARSRTTRRTARTGGAKTPRRATARRPGARKKAVRKKAVRKTTRTRTTAARKRAAARSARRRAARPAARSRKPASGRKSPARRKTAPKRKAAPVRKKAAAPKATARPRRTPRRPRKKAPPWLDRERRVLRDEPTEPGGPPSSLDFERRASSAETGRSDMQTRRDQHHESDPRLTGGDVDANWEEAYFSGDEAPGGDNPTPDQDVVEEIGRSLGVEYQDHEELHDKVVERDKHRWELDPASSEDYRDRGKR